MVLAFLGVAVPVGAAPILFIGSDQGAGSADPRPNSDAAAAAFDAAAALGGSVSLVTFEAAPLGVFNNLVIAAGVTMDGTNFSGGDQQILNAPRDVPDNLFGYNTTAGGTQFVDMFSGTLTFTFAPGVHAFGAYLSGLQGTIVGQQVITYVGGGQEIINIPMIEGGIAFVGFTDFGQSIASVQISVLNDIVGVDDVRFGQQTGVPEPTTMLLLGSGLAAAGLRRYRRKKNQ